MFERYTEPARRVIFFGRYEASEAGSAFIDTEHLLLGIVREEGAALGELAGTPDPQTSLREAVAARKPASGNKIPLKGDLPLSSAAKRVLAYAAEEAERLGHYQIAPLHLLLGLMRDEESVAFEILKSHQINVADVRERMARQIASGPAAPPTDHAAMLQMISGFWVSRALYVAAKLGIADLVKTGPKTIDELAAATGSHASSLYRAMRALASIGVFIELPGGKIASTPLAATLETAPGSLRWIAMAELGQEHYSAWEEFPYSVRTGGMAFTEKFKQPVWEYYATHQEEADVFNHSMTGLTQAATQAILAAYDFSAFHKIIDIGGGEGSLLTSILSAAKSATGIVFDSPAVIGKPSEPVERLERQAGNFFEAVPTGGDCYTLKLILHDWTDEECVTILSNIRKAMQPGGKLLIFEMVLGSGPDAHFKNFLDLNMMVMTGGRERTAAEFTAVLEKSGFKLTRVLPTASLFGIVEAVPEP